MCLSKEQVATVACSSPMVAARFALVFAGVFIDSCAWIGHTKAIEL